MKFKNISVENNGYVFISFIILFIIIEYNLKTSHRSSCLQYLDQTLEGSFDVICPDRRDVQQTEKVFRFRVCKSLYFHTASSVQSSLV